VCAIYIIYIHIYIHNIYIYIYTHTHTHIHTYIQTYIAYIAYIYNRVSILHREETESDRERQREQARRRSPVREGCARGKPPRFVIAGIYKQYPPSTRRRGFPKRNMVIRAMVHIDMNDARH